MLGTVLKRLFRDRSRNTRMALDALQRARAALGEQDMAAAEAALASALQADPTEPEAYVLRAGMAKSLRLFHAAADDYRRALLLRPHSVDVRINLSAVLHQLAQFEDALEVLNDAVAIAPHSALVQMNRGLMLRELVRLAEAEQALRRACDLDVCNVEARCRLASVLHDQGRREEADEILRQVLASDRENAEAHWQLAIQALGAGDFAAGWRHYEYRLRRHDAYVRRRELPWWDGARPPAGPLLVLAEQGLGDEIMFASCFGDLLSQVKDCIVECDSRLDSLFARSFPHARILAERDPTSTLQPRSQEAVAQIAAGSLPGLYRRRARDFPRHRGYLQASAQSVVRWREHLDTLGPGLRVGLSWVGGSWKTRRAMRSVRLADLQPVFDVTGVHFVSLQYTDCQAELEALASAKGVVLHHWPEAIADYDQTAGLVAALDLVISVTTSIVHLAGALGKPVWVLVPTASEWRYLRAGETMPWYPSARLFRQTILGAWAPVIRQIAESLHGEAARAEHGRVMDAPC